MKQRDQGSEMHAEGARLCDEMMHFVFYRLVVTRFQSCDVDDEVHLVGAARGAGTHFCFFDLGEGYSERECDDGCDLDPAVFQDFARQRDV